MIPLDCMPDITVNFLPSPQDSANSTSECRLSRPPVQYLPMPSANTSAASVFKKGSIFAGLSEQEFGLLAVRMVQRRRVDLLQRRNCAQDFTAFKPALADANRCGQTDGPGGSVAELPVFDGVNYLAAQAITDCSLSFLSKKDS